MLKKLFFKLTEKKTGKKNGKVKSSILLGVSSLNLDVEPSIFEAEGRQFLGDYIGKLVDGHGYKVVGGFIILEDTAKVVRRATTEESYKLDDGIYKMVT